MGGGTTTEIYQPEPQAQPTVGDSINDYVSALPQLYEAQMKYDPLIAQQQLEMLEQYGTRYGEATKATQEALYPETAALQEQLAGQASIGMEQGLTTEEEQLYRDYLTSNLGTNVGSGIGADYLSRGMVSKDIERRDYYRNLGLSVAGRQPLAQGEQPSSVGYMQQFQPGQALNYTSSNYGTYVAGSQPMTMQSQQPDWLGGTGSVLSGLGAMGMTFSDSRLKENVRKIGNVQGNDLYKFNFKGSPATQIGVIAQEVDEKYTQKHESGYLMVDYDGIFEEE